MNEAVFLFVENNEPSYCPICGELLLPRSRRPRKLIDNDGNQIVYYIRRLRCAPCNRIHHELPDRIVPYKRHCAETIENITHEKTNDTPCEEKTVKRIFRWWNAIHPYFLNILKSLTMKYKNEYHSPPVFKEIIRAAVNSNNWIFVDSVCTRSACMSG